MTVSIGAQRETSVSRGQTGAFPWPTPLQELALTAALATGDAAVEAFRRCSGEKDSAPAFDRSVVRLLPLIYANLRSSGLVHPLLPYLKETYRRSWVENHQLVHAVVPVVAHLAKHGIKTVFVKGVPLALSYYANPGVRPMSDADIVVPAAAARRAAALLKELGWLPVDTASEEDFRYRHAMSFRDAAGHELDLHWHFLFEACNASADAVFWNAVRELDFSGVRTLQLNPTFLLLHTIIHGVRFNVEPPIRWIPDALAILRSAPDEIDWAAMLDFARSQKILSRLGLGLNYLATRQNAPIPKTVLQTTAAIRPSFTERIENTVVLRDARGALSKPWAIFADYCRAAHAQNPWSFILGFAAYVRYRRRGSLLGRRSRARLQKASSAL